MTISSVSKSDEGFYHCKHPERGESLKSWISVRYSPSSATGVIIGLSLTFTFVIIMIVIIMLFYHKKKKDAAYQTPSTINQDTTQPPADDNVYEIADVAATDVSASGTSSQALTRNQKQTNAGAGPSDVIYADIELKNQKKPKMKQGKSSKGDDTVYSELKQNTDEDAAAGPSDVTYAKIDLKKLKKPKKKQGKNNEGSDTLYSELKKNIDKDENVKPKYL
ncbi:uncharacterized protein LOC124382537 isoform X2 [Silurus meridionalis]|uniref:uncharacterized protein LOC124382537 isoform X2 n=1 Tax=Silurus meridionalis TaxID=175797 RepID=UPI001EECAE4B|nr:uncharacterized protein LOC124382537 isoform X2 [Silurus meridionalis]